MTKRELSRGTGERKLFFAHKDPSGASQLLRDHLLQVSRAARSHAEKIGIGTAGSAVGLLHDLGKYSHAFQRYLDQMTLHEDTEHPELERGKIDHSTAGAQAIWRELKGRGTQDGIVGEILALCLASHHSGLIDCITPAGADGLSRRMNKSDPDTHSSEAWSNAEAGIVELYENLVHDPDMVGGLRGRIVAVCELDSSKLIVRFKLGLLVRFLFSCLIDADRSDTADSSRPNLAPLRQRGVYTEWAALIDRLERKLGGFVASTQVDRLRREVSEKCLSASTRPRGLFTLTVPTGGGKTLASLRFGLHHAANWGMDRVIYVSPFTSIIDQNAAVVRAILEPSHAEFGSVVLEHHSNLTPEQQTWKSKVLSENWDSPVVFTTAVQLLEALFGSGTRAVRRMHQLANSVLIFDEVQTLPVRCVHMFNNAVNFLVEQCKSTVVLCTATQPLLHRVDERKGAIRLGGQAEIMRDVATLFTSVKRYETYDRRKPGGWEPGEAAALAFTEMQASGSCLVVVNTKREAQSIFREAKAIAEDAIVVHLSTNMCPAHRMRVLHRAKRHLCLRRRPVICISTQLIEAGVDISFGSVVRALAGVDSIAQAAGRCNRHGEGGMGRVHVINMTAMTPKSLHDIRAAQEAANRVLDESGEAGGLRPIELERPEVIERYYHYYFFDRRKEMDYPVGPDRAQRDDTLLNMLAENRLAVSMRSEPPPIFLRQAFKTAAEAFQSIDANTRGMIVPYTSAGKTVIADLSAAYEPRQQFRLLKRAQLFTVNVFPHILKKLEQAGAVHEVQEGTGILYLNERYYNTAVGLDVEGEGEMEFHDA